VALPSPLQLPPNIRQSLFANGEQMAQALALEVAERLRTDLRQHGAASFAVPGGRTPALFQNALARQPLDWPRISVTLTDDRWVPTDHLDSNERLLRTQLLHGDAAAARFLPLVDTGVAPERQRANVEQMLSQSTRPYAAVVLGMGDDGHTASLFPGAAGTAAALDPLGLARAALIAPTTAAHLRISLTVKALLDTDVVMILIQGEGKRAAIEQAALSQPEAHPIAAFLRQSQIPVHVYYGA
jgi:6-phosphogluconolactonase